MLEVFKKQNIYIDLKKDENKGFEIIKTPKIKIKNKNEIHIENLYGVSDKISNLHSDITAALTKNFICEEYKIDKSRKRFLIKLFNIKDDVSMRYKSIEGFEEYLSHFEKHQIPIDINYKYDAIKSPHILVSGTTGSGKTYFLYNIILANMVHNNQIYIFDRKRDISRFHKVIGKENVATDLEEIVPLINKIYEKMILFEEMLEGVSSNELANDFRVITDNLTYIIIDEMASISNELDKKEREEFMSKIKYIAQRGRSAGYILVISMQQANAKTLPTDIRDQFNFRIVLGTSAKTTLDLVLDVPDIQDVDVGVGRGQYTDSSLTKSKFITTPYFDFELNFDVIRKIPKLVEIRSAPKSHRETHRRDINLYDVTMEDKEK